MQSTLQKLRFKVDKIEVLYTQDISFTNATQSNIHKRRNPGFWCLYIFVFVFTTTFSALAQQPSFQWAKGFFTKNKENYSQYNNGRTVGVDGQGNVYSAGFFQHTIDMDPSPAVHTITGKAFEECGIYISKLDAAGNFIWGEQIPILIEWAQIELKVDYSGNVYLTSYLSGEADMDPGPGVFLMKSIGFKDAFVIKISTDGNLVWAKQLGGPGDTGAETTSLDLDKDNNVIVCGAFNNTVDFDPGPSVYNLTATAHFQAFVVKLNNNGDLVNAFQFGNSPVVYNGSSISDVKCDAAGNICLTGTFSGTCDFDPGPASFNLASSVMSDVFIAKVTAEGSLIWAEQLQSTKDNPYDVIAASGIDIDGNDDILITGSYIGTRDFDPGPSVYSIEGIAGTYDCYILKLNKNGAFVWAKRIGDTETDGGNDIITDRNNNIYITGNFGVNETSVDFDPGAGDYIIGSKGYDLSVILKLSPSGNFVYLAPIYGSDYGTASIRRMTINPAGEIFFTGSLWGDVDFDPGTNKYILSTNEETPYVCKFAPCGHPTASTLNITTCDSYTLNDVQFDSSGTFIQVIPNMSGCDSVITLNLKLTKTNTLNTKTICEGDSLFAGGNYQTTAGIYTDTLHTQQGCDSVVATRLEVNPRPFPYLGADKNICSNEELKISPGSFASYLWQDGSTGETFTINNKGTFWVKVTNDVGCTAADTLLIKDMLLAPGNFLKEKDSLCSYESIQIAPYSSYLNYQWSTGETTRSISVQHPRVYSLAVTDEEGCRGSDTITIYAKECMSGIYVPSAFSPNNDGKNDIFKPILFGKVVNYRFIVYNRWGKKVFQSYEPDNGWDGSVGQYTQDANVFVWVCSYQLEDSGVKTIKGTVTLVR